MCTCKYIRIYFRVQIMSRKNWQQLTQSTRPASIYRLHAIAGWMEIWLDSNRQKREKGWIEPVYYLTWSSLPWPWLWSTNNCDLQPKIPWFPVENVYDAHWALLHLEEQITQSYNTGCKRGIAGCKCSRAAIQAAPIAPIAVTLSFWILIIGFSRAWDYSSWPNRLKSKLGP